MESISCYGKDYNARTMYKGNAPLVFKNNFQLCAYGVKINT